MAQTCPACGCADFKKLHHGQSGNPNVLHCGVYVVCDKKGNPVEQRRTA